VTQAVFIEKIKDGDYRLMWLGRLIRDASAASPLRVEAIFLKQPIDHRAYRPWVVDERPIEELPLLAPQASWRNGRFQGYSDKTFPIQHLTVIPDSARYAEMTKNPPFTEAEYPFYKRQILSSCWVFDTAEGVELVVPGWQILQAWYLFDREIMASVLAGMLDVTKDYGAEVPWLPGTACVERAVTYHLPEHISVPVAKQFSRLLFDQQARGYGMNIWKKLMESESKFPPMARPPHSVPAKWTFRMKPLNTVNGKPRWLLLHLMGAHLPLPYDTFEVVRQRTAEPATENLPPTIVQNGPAVPDPDKPAPLVSGQAGGRGRRGPRMNGMTFIDYSAEDVNETTRIDELPSSKVMGQSLVLPDPTVVLEAASLVTEGKPDKTILVVGIESPAAPAKPPEDPAALFERSRAAYQAIIRYVHDNPHPAGWGWRAEMMFNNSVDQFVIAGPVPRYFLILELQVADQCTYLVEVLRRADDAEFPLCQVRNTSRSRMSSTDISRWLNQFPYDGQAPWGGSSQVPKWLLGPLTVRHQPTKLPAYIEDLRGEERMARAEAHLVEGLWTRLLKHMMDFETKLATGAARAQRKLSRKTLRDV